VLVNVLADPASLLPAWRRHMQASHMSWYTTRTRDLAPVCDEGAVVIPTSWFAAAAQNADPSRHRDLDRCTHYSNADSGDPISVRELAINFGEP
jgi:hypothetical protein